MQLVRIVPADEDVVGDVEVLGSRPLVLHAAADILQPGMFQSEAARPDDVLQPNKKRHIGVSNRDALEVVVVRRHQVEEILAAVAIEDHFAIAGRFDDDRLSGRAALGQIVSAVERRSQRRNARD